MSEQLRLRDTDLEWRTVEQEVVALDVSDSLYLGVNQSGRILWEALAQGSTREALVQLLIDGYSLERVAAEHDTDVFLADLDGHGLLVPVAPPA